MVFPSTPLDTDVELYVNGAWSSIVRLDNGEAGVFGGNRANVVIKHGRSDETRPDFDTATCSFQVNNRDGRFSPRNPTGDYYGQIGRNTPVRVSIPDSDGSSLRTLGIENANASAPDSATLSVVGDLDLRVDAWLDTWRYRTTLCSKYITTADQRSWAFYVDDDGVLALAWSTAGTLATVTTVESTIPIPTVIGRLSVRVTIDVNNGAAGNDVKFYTSSDTNLSTATWTQLGATVTTAGTTSIFNGTATVNIGDYTPGLTVSGVGQYAKYFSAQIRDGIAGTVVGNPNFNAQTAGAASFADTASPSNTWTMNNGAVIDDRNYRFAGEISEWPQKWDVTGEDVWVDIEASGVTRRISQGASPIGSALYRGTTRIPTLRAYWPCEDGENATLISSAHPTSKPMTYKGTPLFAEYEGTFKSSLPIPEVNGSTWQGSVASYTPASPAEIQLQFIMHITATGPADGTCIMRLFCSGTAPRWDIVYNTGGGLTVNAFDGLNTSILSSGPWAFAVDGKDLLVVVQLTQNGADVNWGLGTYQVNDPTFGLLGTGTQTLAGRTISVATGIHANPPASAGLADDHIGQISVHSTINAWTDPYLQINAYTGETAGERLVRLADEEDLAMRHYGSMTESETLGYQTTRTLLETLREAAAADMGFFADARDFVGVQFRPRRTIYNQTARATFNYTSHQMQSLEPSDDDSATRNDVTVTRIDGGSSRTTLESGTLSVLAPPNGVGRYDEDVSISLETDSQVKNQAGWRLHMGTVDEPRYKMTVELAQPALVASSTLTNAVQALLLGDRIDITNPPAWLPPDTISAVVQGITETLGGMTYKFEFDLQPYSPFATGVYGTARYSNSGCVTNEALDTTETGIDVTNPSATSYWSHADGDFDIIIGGERMTVTAVTGTGVSQTLTVTRSVNGVVKSHATGAAVRLYTPAYWAL